MTAAGPFTKRASRRTGAVLLEVILALTLFVLSAGVIVGSLSSSATALGRLRRRAQAADLAVSLLSEVRLGVVDPVDSGPNDYEDERLEGWTWELVAGPSDASGTEFSETHVEVVIRHDASGTTKRLAALMPDSAAEDEFEYEGDAYGGAP